MRKLPLLVVASLMTATTAHAAESAGKVVRSLFKANEPFNQDIAEVANINTIQIACGIYNEKMKKAHQEAFKAAKAKIGEQATFDQLYLLSIKNANFLLPKGKHETFCEGAEIMWGPDEPSAWDN